MRLSRLTGLHASGFKSASQQPVSMPAKAVHGLSAFYAPMFPQTEKSADCFWALSPLQGSIASITGTLT
jgi:hypothetical protein